MLSGMKAIEAAEMDSTITLSKYADPTEGAREGLTIAEAREIAAEDPGLIYATGPSYKCVSDVYDRDGSTYSSVGEFLEMCEACFGEVPELRQLGSVWVDEDGREVLETMGAAEGHGLADDDGASATSRRAELEVELAELEAKLTASEAELAELEEDAESENECAATLRNEALALERKADDAKADGPEWFWADLCEQANDAWDMAREAATHATWARGAVEETEEEIAQVEAEIARVEAELAAMTKDQWEALCADADAYDYPRVYVAMGGDTIVYPYGRIIHRDGEIWVAEGGESCDVRPWERTIDVALPELRRMMAEDEDADGEDE